MFIASTINNDVFIASTINNDVFIACTINNDVFIGSAVKQGSACFWDIIASHFISGSEWDVVPTALTGDRSVVSTHSTPITKCRT